MKKLFVMLILVVVLLVSANSVLAYEDWCDSCNAIVEGYEECYRRTSWVDSDCPYYIGCPGEQWWCYTDWCCIYGHATWTTYNDHIHAYLYHEQCLAANWGLVCPF